MKGILAMSEDAKFGQARDAFLEAQEAFKAEQEDFWNSLSKEQQLKAFCAVVRRLVDGELDKQGTYRYVLYETFGFGPNAYVPAQMAGFLELHNSICAEGYDSQLLHAFCRTFSIDDADQKIIKFLV